MQLGYEKKKIDSKSSIEYGDNYDQLQLRTSKFQGGWNRRGGKIILEIKLAQWVLIKIIFPLECTPSLASIYVPTTPSQTGLHALLLFLKEFESGHRSHIIICQDGVTFQRENNFNENSLR